MNLTFDLSFYLYRTAHAITSKRGRFLYEVGDGEFFVHEVMKSIFYDIQRFRNEFGNIVIAADSSRSFRYSIFDKYKQRDKSEIKFNYEYFKEIENELCDYLKTNQNFIFLKTNTLEADDLMAYWSLTNLGLKNKSSIIFSGDGDIGQLLKRNKDNYIYVYNPFNPNSKLDIPQTMKPDENEESDIFYSGDIHTGIDINKIGYNIVDPARVLFVKLLVGDTSDTIPTSYFRMIGEKTRRVVNKNIANTIYDRHFIKTDHYDISNMNKVFDFMTLKSEHKKIFFDILSEMKSQEINKLDEFSSNIEMNSKLICLYHHKLEPIKKYFELAHKEHHQKLESKEIMFKDLRLDDMVKGSQYENISQSVYYKNA